MKISKNSQFGRSALAVCAGFVSIALASHGVDTVLRAVGAYPASGQPMSDALFASATVYRTLFGVLGCYLAARLAPNNPTRHALILGFIGTLLATLGAVATWNRGPAFGPHWYPISLILTALPAALVGGRLYTRTSPALVGTGA